MADNTIANAIKFLKGEEKSLPATKTDGQVYFAYKNVGTAEKPSYTGAIYIDTPIGGTQNRIKMTANADIADKAFNDSAGASIRDTYLSSLGYTDDGKQTILIKGSGNTQTRIALPIASTIKSGIVTTDAQSFGGTKTFTTINSNSLTVTGAGSFNYSGIGSGTADAVRPVWFADNSDNGKPVINANFTYNPVTQTLSVANLSGTAQKASNDDGGQNIRSTYIKNITVNGTTLTITKGGGATSSITLQDTNNKVTQTAVKASDYINWRTILWGSSNSEVEGFTPTTVTDCAFTSDTLIFQPSSGTLKAKIFKGSLSGNAETATSANKLNTNAGSATRPVYFSGGKPVACTYTINASVPADAKFTDTNTWRPLGTTADTACAGNDSRLSNARPASDVYAWAKASSKPSYSWGEIIGKPGSFTPSFHTHDYVVGSYTDNGGQQNPNYFGTNKVGFLMMNTTVNGDSSYKDWIIMDCYSGDDIGGGVALGVNRQKLAAYIMRSDASRKAWAESAELLHTSNYTSYTVTKTGSGASGTWGISISGSSASCTGNAATATILQTPHTINGTSFNGSANIITAKWGTGRYISIKDCDSSNTGTAVLVDGSSNTSLYMPSSARFSGTVGIGSNSGATLKFYSDATTISAKIVAYNDRIEFVFS